MYDKSFMSVCGNVFRAQNKFSPFPLSPTLPLSLFMSVCLWERFKMTHQGKWRRTKLGVINQKIFMSVVAIFRERIKI